MTDQTDTAAQLAALLAQIQASGATATATPSAWNKPAMPSVPAEVLGVSIPIKVDTPAGQVRCYLNFPASAASSPTALFGLLEQLAAAGLPLDTWQPKESSSTWGGSQGSHGGGWGNRGGGNGYGGNRGGYGGSGWRR